jgi:hypothetical protein
LTRLWSSESLRSEGANRILRLSCRQLPRPV